MAISADEPLIDRLYDFVAGHDHVTFAEIVQRFPETKGEYMMMVPNMGECAFWADLSQETTEAIRTLVVQKKIEIRPAHLLSYFADGMSMALPIARRVRVYKKMHWLPVCLCLPKQSGGKQLGKATHGH